MISVQNKTALITGSSRGIGQQVALGLAQLGCNIVVHGRSEQRCAETLDLLKQYEVKTYCVNGELSDEKSINQVIKQVKALMVPIDILYNNAAIMSPYRHDFWTHTFDRLCVYEK